MTLTEIDRSIASATFILKKRKDRLEELNKRLNLNGDQQIFIGEERELIKIMEALIKRYRDDVNKNLGKLPPQATDMEEAVLGAIMLETGTIVKVAPFLKTEHFYLEANKEIYNACKSLLVKNDPIDMKTVVMELRRSGKAEQVGGAYRIAEITSKVSSAANVEYHARVVVEMAVKRHLLLMASKVIGEGYDDTNDCFVLLNEVKDAVATVETWTEK